MRNYYRYGTIIFFLLVPSIAHAWDVTTAVIGHWKLNENAANGNVVDSSGSTTGTLFGSSGGVNTSVVTTTGKLNGAFLFDGATHGYGVDLTSPNDISSSVDFSRTTPWSVEVWFKTTNSGEIDLVSDFAENVVAGWAVELDGGKIQVFISNSSSNWILQLSSSTYNDGSFHHLVVTYSGSSTAAGLIFYIDGSSVSKAAATHDNLSSAISYSAATPAIGLRNNASTGTGALYSGTLDEVLIYNRVLTSTEVTGRYNSGTGTESLASSARRRVAYTQ